MFVMEIMLPTSSGDINDVDPFVDAKMMHFRRILKVAPEATIEPFIASATWTKIARRFLGAALFFERKGGKEKNGRGSWERESWKKIGTRSPAGLVVI